MSATSDVHFTYGDPDDMVQQLDMDGGVIHAVIHDDEIRRIPIRVENGSLFVLNDFHAKLIGLHPDTYQAHVPRYVRPAHTAEIIFDVDGSKIYEHHADKPVDHIEVDIQYTAGRTLGIPYEESGPPGVGTYRQRTGEKKGV